MASQKTHRRLVTQIVGAAFCLLFSVTSFSAFATDEQLKYLQDHWAIANYKAANKKAKKEMFETLLEEADKFVAEHPNDASLIIWRGIIESTYAGVKGGLGAMKYAKASKADFEHAMKIDDKALGGSAYTSLGTLYFKVPGWPIGFGDDDKAEQLLKTALQINPNGIDSNYFYAEFLRDNKNYEAAEQFYMKALQAPAREGREMADEGRREEISAALAELREKQ